MSLCNYGCEKKAEFYFPTVGKWCCSPHWTLCPIKRRENSIQTKKLWKDPNNKLNSILRKKKQSVASKKSWQDPNSGHNSILCKEKKSKANKLTIEKIKEKYKFFSIVEEMRYNPDKPGEKEIQVHCKNHGCPNSKEKGGWFTPTAQQFKDRKNHLQNEGEDKSGFYCSQYCKDTCPCYNLRTDPFQLVEFERYNREVWKYTNLNVKYNFDKIRNIELRGNKCGYDLDHKFSIMEGFNNNIDPKVIGYWRNLEVITAFDNRKKCMTSSISLKEIQKIEKLSDNYMYDISFRSK